MGGAARAAARGWTSRGRGGGAANCGARAGGGRWLPDALRVFGGQLAATADGSAEHLLATARVFAHRAAEASRRGSAAGGNRKARSRAAGAAAGDRADGAGDGRGKESAAAGGD